MFEEYYANVGLVGRWHQQRHKVLYGRYVQQQQSLSPQRLRGCVSSRIRALLLEQAASMYFLSLYRRHDNGQQKFCISLWCLLFIAAWSRLTVDSPLKISYWQTWWRQVPVFFQIQPKLPASGVYSQKIEPGSVLCSRFCFHSNSRSCQHAKSEPDKMTAPLSLLNSKNKRESVYYNTTSYIIIYFSSFELIL